MPYDFSDSARALLLERKRLQDQVIVTPEVWVRDLHIEPATPYFRTNNFLQNTLARLVGWYPTAEDWRRLLCDAQGRLEVSTIQASYNKNETKRGAVTSSWSAWIAFGDIVKRLDIFVWDYAMYLKRSIDGIIEDDYFEIPANTMYSVDGTTHSVKVTNAVTGNLARYQLVGWW